MKARLFLVGLVICGGAGLVACQADLDKTVQRREIRFRNGTVTLAGTLTIPEATGLLPAVILLHGSRVSTRSDFRDYARLLPRFGFATLAFDKRGCGGSDGELELASFEDLAEDALAARLWLARQPKIDAERIGFLGVSQGGWIGPLAASRDPAVAFVIAVSAPGMTPFEQSLYVLDQRMRKRGIPPADAEEFLSLVPRWWRYWLNRERYDELSAAMRRWEHSPAMQVAVNEGLLVDYLTPPGELPSTDLMHVPPSLRSGDHDPFGPLASLKTPVLYAFGESDHLLPAERSAAAYRLALSQSRHPDWTVRVFPNADHGIRVPRGPDLLIRPAFSPEYVETLRKWLSRFVAQALIRDE